ncbi:hypothetical protein [Pseudonocardia oroxyli]|uniref:Uncharacterized protein n=1 Tax=Pseudonocardia oroxyli TaxID=366584 RepID=A0A1G7MQL9_PSEOR|nr:hypothetical protein [Pseudonocardia oroxyli]SDF64075.1 hypothetical protein SAMN05216377_10619 [Pseudonocardia oroxyli]
MSTSPDFRRQTPVDRLPTLIRTRHGYRVFDPALIAGTRYVIDDDGTLVWTRLPAGTTALAVLAAGAATALLLADGWLLGLLWFLAGVVAATGLAGLGLTLVHAVSGPERGYRRRTGGAPHFTDVTDRGSRPWALCEQAERLAATRSWVTGRVDRQRRLPELLWAGVQGSGDAAAEIGRLADPPSRPELRVAHPQT